MKNKQFKEWYNKKMLLGQAQHFYDINAFYRWKSSMQWGVYLEFFDSVGIHITIEYMKIGDYFKIKIQSKDEVIHYNSADEAGYYTTKERQEAQTEAVKKAFEILESN